MTRPERPLLASFLRWMAEPRLPSASVSMSQVRPAISFALRPALTESSRITRFLSGVAGLLQEGLKVSGLAAGEGLGLLGEAHGCHSL